MNTFLMEMNGENHAFWIRPTDGRIINRARMGPEFYNMDTGKHAGKNRAGQWSLADAMSKLTPDGFIVLDSELDRIEAFLDFNQDITSPRERNLVSDYRRGNKRAREVKDGTYSRT